MDILLNPINYFSEPTCETACILHPHAAILWLICFNSVDDWGNGFNGLYEYTSGTYISFIVCQLKRITVPNMQS